MPSQTSFVSFPPVAILPLSNTFTGTTNTFTGTVVASVQFTGSIAMGTSRPAVGSGFANTSSSDRIQIYTGSTLRGSIEPLGGWIIGTVSGTETHVVWGTVAIQNAGELRLHEGSSGANYTGFKAAASLTVDTMYTLPTGDGTGGYVLSTNGSATLSWVPNGAGYNSSNEITNVGIANSVGASALTIALKDGAGSDPSVGSAVKIGFRVATAATGTYVQRTVTAALSTVISSGSTAGFTSGQTERLYVYALDNAGTVELAWSGARIWDEGQLQTTTAEGGAGAADSKTTLYSTTARSGVAIRFLGYLQFSLTTAGTWDEVADVIAINPSNKDNAPYGEVILTTPVASPNGYGSAATVIRRFTTTEKNTAASWATVVVGDASAGMSVTILQDGLYAVDYCDQPSGASGTLGISVNSNQLTTSIALITAAHRKALMTMPSNSGGQVSCVIPLVAGDVVRAHAGTALSTDASPYIRFSIKRIGPGWA